MYLALDNLQWLMCHKTILNKTKSPGILLDNLPITAVLGFGQSHSGVVVPYETVVSRVHWGGAFKQRIYAKQNCLK